MRILVYEHISGGGFSEKPIPQSILSEGFGMLRTLTADLCSAGHAVTTLLDTRILAFRTPLQAERIIAVSSFGDLQSTIKQVARSVDMACVIAPESNGTLEMIVKDLEEEALPLLNCSSSTIAAVSNKSWLLENVRKLGIQTPKSLVLDIGDNERATAGTIEERVGFPAIVKPENDTGMAGLSVVKNRAEVKAAVRKITRESTGGRFLAQEYVDGIHASVSLVSTGQEVVPLSLNKQKIRMSSAYSSSMYDGGEVPLENELGTEARNAAKRVVDSFNGLKGYLGVDIVLAKENPVVIEVNPRLTTSYIGLRKVTQSNLAQVVIDAVISRKVPTIKQAKGCASFSKVVMPNPSIEALEETFKMEEVVSPPFPFSTEPNAVALVCSNGATLPEAKRLLEKAKRKVPKISSSGGSQD